MVKVNDGYEWSSNGMMLWLERRKNKDVVGRVVKFEMIYL
jgi:hypothetical protein